MKIDGRKMTLIAQQLKTLGIIDPSAVEVYFPGTRDRSDIKVNRCVKSGLIFLDDDKISETYYENKQGASYWGGSTREEALRLSEKDDSRRENQFLKYVSLPGSQCNDIRIILLNQGIQSGINGSITDNGT